jgi:hypothetical protein
MEAMRSSQKSVNFYQTVRRHTIKTATVRAANSIRLQCINLHARSSFVLGWHHCQRDGAMLSRGNPPSKRLICIQVRGEQFPRDGTPTDRDISHGPAEIASMTGYASHIRSPSCSLVGYLGVSSSGYIGSSCRGGLEVVSVRYELDCKYCYK